MTTFKPKYELCKDPRKELFWDICKHSKKDTFMWCTLSNNKRCFAWKGYKHGDK